MQTILIVIHLMVVVALVGVVLLQRSEGGGLGIGGGSGFMTARGASNALTRTTGILAGTFFATSLALSLIARYGENPTDILDRLPQNTPQQEQQDGGSGGNGILDQLGGSATGGGAEGEGQGTSQGSSQSGDVPTGQSDQSNDAGQSDQSSGPAPETDSAPASPESQVPTGQ